MKIPFTSDFATKRHFSAVLRAHRYFT
jgi:hypothetical protein